MEKDKKLLNVMLHARTECFDFMMQSEFIDCVQSEIESILSEKVDPGTTYPGRASILEIGIELDKKIHADDNDAPIANIDNIVIDGEDLRKSMLSIINNMK